MNYYKLPSDKTFLVSLKAVIVNDGKILLLKSTAAHGKWELPGGLVDIEEKFEDGLKRELQEETTLEINIGKVIGGWEIWRTGFKFYDGAVRDARIVEIIYACELVGGDVVLSEEHSESLWAKLEELDSLNLFVGQKEAIKNLLEK